MLTTIRVRIIGVPQEGEALSIPIDIMESLVGIEFDSTGKTTATDLDILIGRKIPNGYAVRGEDVLEALRQRSKMRAYRELKKRYPRIASRRVVFSAATCIPCE